MPSAEAKCQDYVKLGVNIKEEMEKYMSGCGCSYDVPTQCTDLDIKAVEGKLSCEASEDCKKGIQSIYDMWNISIPITNPSCLVAFEAIQWMNDVCIKQ